MDFALPKDKGIKEVSQARKLSNLFVVETSH